MHHSRALSRVYAILALYLIVCSFALAAKAFQVSFLVLCEPRFSYANYVGQNIPNELKNKTTAQVILTFFTPPVGALIAAMVSTFGIYFTASFLYVSTLSFICPCGLLIHIVDSAIRGTCSQVSCSTCA